MSERFRCSRLSAAEGEPLSATASLVQRWVLLEQPGAWGRDAVLDSALPDPLARELLARTRAAGARLLLIRRHGRHRGGGRTAFVAVSEGGRRWVERFDLARADDLLDVDLAPLARDASVGGAPVAEPLYLVCTNGGHDPCCAEFGRPVAAALQAARPGQVWESSHVGGCRFAGNVVCLPDGLYFGRVTPADAAGLADRYDGGTVDLTRYRGRAGVPWPAQAAEDLVRARLGLDGVDAVTVLAAEPLGATRTRVRLAAGGRELVATVDRVPGGEARPLTCTAPRGLVPPAYRLVELTGAP